jgi:hypothetical protein
MNTDLDFNAVALLEPVATRPPELGSLSSQLRAI